ncbi:MAG: hypothetical protein M0C28_41730 [Candidatus Moduliflexus flocculans]|nr:hypothetical protein [Candidatus Moduliflexus flocculans]
MSAAGAFAVAKRSAPAPTRRPGRTSPGSRPSRPARLPLLRQDPARHLRRPSPSSRSSRSRPAVVEVLSPKAYRHLRRPRPRRPSPRRPSCADALARPRAPPSPSSSSSSATASSATSSCARSDSRRRAEILVVVVLASALFQAFYGMAEVFSGHETILGRPKRYNLGSVTGTYVNRNHLAGFLEMAFPLSLGYLLVKARYFAMEKGLSLRRKIVWFGQESLQWTLLLGLVPVFIGLGLVFSKSRSGILVLAVTAVLAAAAAASWREFSDADGEGRRPGEPGAASDGIVRARRRRRSWPRPSGSASGPVIGPLLRGRRHGRQPAGRSTANTLEHDRRFPCWPGRARAPTSTPTPCTRRSTTGCRLSFAHNDYLEFAAENGIVGRRRAHPRRPRPRSSGSPRCGAAAAARSPRASASGRCWASRPSSSTASPTSTSRSRPTPSISRHWPCSAVAVLGERMETAGKRTRKDMAVATGDTYRIGCMSPLKILVARLLAVVLFVPAVRDFARLPAPRRLPARPASEARSASRAPSRPSRPASRRPPPRRPAPSSRSRLARLYHGDGPRRQRRRPRRGSGHPLRPGRGPLRPGHRRQSHRCRRPLRNGDGLPPLQLPPDDLPGPGQGLFPPGPRPQAGRRDDQPQRPVPLSSRGGRPSRTPTRRLRRRDSTGPCSPATPPSPPSSEARWTRSYGSPERLDAGPGRAASRSVARCLVSRIVNQAVPPVLRFRA